jgi:hypothetical protein
VTLIEQQHDQIVSNKHELRQHLLLIHRSHELLHSLLRKHGWNGDDELILLRLAARMFNTAGAAMSLARGGFFQPAFAMVRDIIEVEFLTDLFSRDRTELVRWTTVDKKTRKREFQQAKIREKLDSMDGFTEKRRQKEYELFCTHASHADPDGFHIISPGNLTEIGPFPSEKNLEALFQELAKHLPPVCINLVTLLAPSDKQVHSAIKAFKQALAEWRSRFMSAQVDQR